MGLDLAVVVNDIVNVIYPFHDLVRPPEETCELRAGTESCTWAKVSLPNRVSRLETNWFGSNIISPFIYLCTALHMLPY